MKAIILAAGKGTRLKPLTDTTPKPLLLLKGKPILEHIINSLPRSIDELIIVVGYKGDQLKKHFGNSFDGRKVSYVEQKEQLGTGHAALLTKHLLKDGERFIFMYADDLHDKKSIEKCLEHNLSMLVKEVLDPRPFGVVAIDENGIVTNIEEKPVNPKSNLVNIGVYVLDTRIFSYPAPLSKVGEYYLTDMIALLAQEHPVHTITTSFWHPIGYVKDIESAEKMLDELQSI